MSYSHLSAEERLEFYQLRVNQALSLAEIAKQMNRSRSTLSREWRRNSVEPGLYLPNIAEQKKKRRRQESKTRFETVSAETITEIRD